MIAAAGRVKGSRHAPSSSALEAWLQYPSLGKCMAGSAFDAILEYTRDTYKHIYVLYCGTNLLETG